MPKLSSTKFQGYSGNNYSFEVYSLDSIFAQNLPGVYVLSHRTKIKDGQFSLIPLFIGQKSDLSTLIGYHKNQKCLLANGFNTKCIHVEPDPSTRLTILEDLLALHSPLCQ